MVNSDYLASAQQWDFRMTQFFTVFILQSLPEQLMDHAKSKIL